MHNTDQGFNFVLNTAKLHSSHFIKHISLSYFHCVYFGGNIFYQLIFIDKKLDL